MISFSLEQVWRRALGAVLLTMLPLAAAPRQVVRVAAFPHPPAIEVDAAGQARGFYVDMLREVAQRENWDLRFVPGTWQEGLERIRRGEVDLLTTVAYTPERDAFLDFGKEASFTVWSLLYTHPGSGIQSILDVRGRHIGVMRGDINGEHFKSLCAQFNLLVAYEEFPTFEAVLQATAEGRVDGGVTTNIYGYANEGRFRVERSPVVFSPFSVSFATAQDRHAEVLAALDAYLKAGKAQPDSSYHRILKRWLAPQPRAGLPAWLLPVALGILGAFALAVLAALVFRHQVERATREIRQLNQGLSAELEARHRMEDQILHVASGVSASSGEGFLHDLVSHLAQATGADGAFIGEIVVEEGIRRVRSLAVLLDGTRGPAVDYPLTGSPCERALKGELCVFERGVQQRFPDQGFLKEVGAQSYVGAPLLDSQGQVQGVLAVIHREPLADPRGTTSLLRIFSARAAGELERRHSHEQQQLLERQMQHAQKLESLGVLAGGIAHDFNNLLTAMLGHMNVAQLKLAPESPALPHLERLEKIIHRAADLTRQMLAYSGRGRFVIRPYDLNQVVQEVTHLLEVSIPKKVALRFNLAPSLPAVEADAAQIQQVIMNLVTNAADAIGDQEGTIRLSTALLQADRGYLDQVFQGQDLKPGAYVTLEVGDTGCGMTPEVMGRIFEPFFTTKVTGRGLGLSATLGILKGHRAGMRIYSEPGRGTTFKLLFPTSDAQRQEASAEVAAAVLTQRATVLLVDDEEMIREAASAALSSLGLTVLTAADGREALAQVSRQGARIDLVLMDLTMPQMDGREAFQAIRKLRPDLPIILSSGYSEHESVQSLEGRGLDGFLQKPYTLKGLERTVLSVLAKRRD